MFFLFVRQWEPRVRSCVPIRLPSREWNSKRCRHWEACRRLVRCPLDVHRQFRQCASPDWHVYSRSCPGANPGAFCARVIRGGFFRSVLGSATHTARRQCALTIRSSGPLRRVAVLSNGGQQRPLNSSVRGIAWNASSIQMCRRSASVSPAAKASAAHAQYQLIAASRAPTYVGPLLSRYPGSRSPQSTTLGFILFNASPSLFLRWCFSLQASISFPCTRVTPSRGLYWLLALYSHWSAPLHGLGSCAKGSAVQTPNYSFKRTAATVRAIIMRRSAAAA